MENAESVKGTRFQFDWMVPLLLICLVLLAGYFASRFATERAQQESKIEVFNALGSIRAKLETLRVWLVPGIARRMQRLP